jgi:hypothetical protein
MEVLMASIWKAAGFYRDAAGMFLDYWNHS